MKNPSITLKDKIKAKNRMYNRIAGIIDKGESEHALNVKTIWDKVVSSTLDDSGPSAKLSISGLVSILIEQLGKEGAKGKSRALFDLWTDTLNIKNYGSLIEKAFCTKINPKEIEEYQMYSQAIRTIMKCATFL